MIKNKLLLIAFLFLSTSISAANTNGFDFILQRYVYNESNNGGISIDLTNGNKDKYLMEAWVSNADPDTLLPKDKSDNETVPFIILPPLKTMEPESQTSWNIRRTGIKINDVDIPKDRESLFWIAIRAIPSEEKKKSNNSIQLNIVPNFYFKLLYRPKLIEELKTKNLAKEIKIKRNKNKIEIKNPTPFYFTFDYLKVAGNYIKNGEREITLSPFSTKEVTLPNNNAGKIEWRFSDEYLMALPTESSD